MPLVHPGTDHTRTHTRLKTAIFSLRHARGASPPPLAPRDLHAGNHGARPGGTGAAAHPPDAPGPPAPALGGFTSASGPSAPPSRRAAAARPRSGRRATYAALKSRLEAPPARGQLACHAPRAATAHRTHTPRPRLRYTGIPGMLTETTPGARCARPRGPVLHEIQNKRRKQFGLLPAACGRWHTCSLYRARDVASPI